MPQVWNTVWLSTLKWGKQLYIIAPLAKKGFIFFISKNDDGKMICSGCDHLHAYTDSIQCHHPMDPAWKHDLITYYNERYGIPKGISFLAGDNTCNLRQFVGVQIREPVIIPVVEPITEISLIKKGCYKYQIYIKEESKLIK